MERGQPLPQPKRPLYCNAFAELECVFNTMTKTRLIELVNLVHWMGGHVREQIDKGNVGSTLVKNGYKVIAGYFSLFKFPKSVKVIPL